jgi:hypothetical protein
VAEAAIDIWSRSHRGVILCAGPLVGAEISKPQRE